MNCSSFSRGGLCIDAFAQFDGAQVELESSGQPLLAHAPVDSAADQLVLGDGQETVDMVVVGVTFVIFGELAGAEHMPVLSWQASAGGRPASGTRAFCGLA